MREGFADRATVKPDLTVHRGSEATGATKRIGADKAGKATARKGAGDAS